MGLAVARSPSPPGESVVAAPTPDLSSDELSLNFIHDDASTALQHKRRSKSFKRKAAEARLAERASARPAPQSPPHLSHRPEPTEDVCVLACSDCQPTTAPLWCGVDVQLPTIDWPAAFAAKHAPLPREPATGRMHLLPGALPVILVDRASALPRALAALRNSMRDSVLGIDLEWRPSFTPSVASESRVALMQLASSQLCILIRLSSMGKTFPTCLHKFLSDPYLTVVGYSWDSADEGRMQRAFGLGRSMFHAFHDVQAVAQALGYHGLGLAALARRVLAFDATKSKKVTMSNWEAWKLSASQVRYAALDAYITGHLFRSLRLWHAAPSECSSCAHPLGKMLSTRTWSCTTCPKSYSNYPTLLSHCTAKRHVPHASACLDCGRCTAATIQAPI